jgi:PTS system mannose-specific IIB component/fructoselysine and glucoselysine-specific PTS system IIB component
MPIVLCRVDDRLVHGQVVIGWGRPLAIELIALVDDTVAASEWEQDLYRMAVSSEIELQFATVADATPRLTEWERGTRRVLILTGDLPTMAALHAADPAAMHRINLGGVHHRAGRRERLPYLYLTDDELRGLQALEAAGAEVQAQDLPTTTPVPLRSIT